MNRGWRYAERIGGRGVGRTVLEHLCREYRHGDEATWRIRIEAGDVEVEGRPAGADHLLEAGEELAWQRPPWEEPEVPLAFGLIHEDEAILVVDKPTGLPTLPGAGFLEHTLLHQVRARHGPADPMHRLGRGTTGLVVFARTADAARVLSAAFRDRAGGSGLVKRYLTLVEGRPAQDAFEIEAPIGRVPDPILGELHAATEAGKPSLSRVRVLERREAASLCEVTIVTGRPHQIRIHLAAAGHPLLGDPLYGVGGGRRPGSTTVPGDLGYLLHAWTLEFRHPASGEPVAFTAPPPEGLVPV
ncbi:MAG: RluA family pseudouridine synthase [Deltaproteobacteria bacterium]|nr:RluA family pseudouridine synthase [Deltaproteobacteria bacterium]